MATYPQGHCSSVRLLTITAVETALFRKKIDIFHCAYICSEQKAWWYLFSLFIVPRSLLLGEQAFV